MWLNAKKKNTWLAVNTFKQFIYHMQYDRFRFVWDVGGWFFPSSWENQLFDCNLLRNYLFWIVLKFLCKIYARYFSKQTQRVLYVGSQDSRSSRWEMTNCTQLRRRFENVCFQEPLFKRLRKQFNSQWSKVYIKTS